MKSPLLLFALKCSVILYFAACSGIGDYTTAVSATPLVTKGAWKVNLVIEADKNQANELTGYSLTFDPAGKIKATKDGTEINGNWSEDDILKRITISLDTKDPQLIMLNNYWNISAVTKTGVTLQNTANPSNGRLQLTSL
ncbi:MAG: hypothetical protein ABI666_10700 [Ferruginibacter sp.]